MGPFSRCLSILIYHRVIREPDPLLPDIVCAADFESQMSLLDRWFRVLPLREAVERLRSGSLPARAACVTFDDGYADNAEIALPILKKRGVPATFFVAADFIDGGRMWNDTVIETIRRAPGPSLDAGALGLGALDLSTLDARREAIAALISALKYLQGQERQERVADISSAVAGELPAALMMTRAQVRALQANGMEIGAHTLSHPILAKLDAERAEFEIAESKRRLESMTGAPVRVFAYPNGKPGKDYLPEHVAMVKRSGFDAAVSTAWGVARLGSDVFQLPRFTPWDQAPGRFLLRLFANTFRANSEHVS
jgi:peptidoglycan/xylan/chitin deacetylase (PgdA/CDA1 family)